MGSTPQHSAPQEAFSCYPRSSVSSTGCAAAIRKRAPGGTMAMTCALRLPCVGDRPPGRLTFQDIDRFIVSNPNEASSPPPSTAAWPPSLALYAFLSAEDPELVCPVLPRRHHLREPQRLPRPVHEDDLQRFFAVIRDPTGSGHVPAHVKVRSAHLRSRASAAGRSLPGRDLSSPGHRAAKARANGACISPRRRSGPCGSTWPSAQLHQATSSSSAINWTASPPPPSTSA